VRCGASAASATKGRDIGAWFITIARNIVLDHVKSARHRLEVTTSEVIEQKDKDPGPEAAVISSLTTEQPDAAVKKLGDDQRDCVVLAVHAGPVGQRNRRDHGQERRCHQALQHRAVRKLAELVRGELR